MVEVDLYRSCFGRGVTNLKGVVAGHREVDVVFDRPPPGLLGAAAHYRSGIGILVRVCIDSNIAASERPGGNHQRFRLGLGCLEGDAPNRKVCHGEQYQPQPATPPRRA